jgi:hypothetical protein
VLGDGLNPTTLSRHIQTSSGVRIGIYERSWSGVAGLEDEVAHSDLFVFGNSLAIDAHLGDESEEILAWFKAPFLKSIEPVLTELIRCEARSVGCARFSRNRLATSSSDSCHDEAMPSTWAGTASTG